MLPAALHAALQLCCAVCCVLRIVSKLEERFEDLIRTSERHEQHKLQEAHQARVQTAAREVRALMAGGDSLRLGEPTEAGENRGE